MKLGDVLRHVPRPVDVQFDTMYREIGIRSHGKGLFHKAPVSGAELGNKRVFFIEPGDFVLNIVFAWEGAVALASERERGMIASHRFPTFRSDEQRLDLRFLLLYFRTPTGVELMGRVSPGGAGRNRTLNRTAYLSLEISLPPLAEQQRLVARIDALSAEVRCAKDVAASSDFEVSAMDKALLHALLPRSTETRPLGSLLAPERKLSYGVLVPGAHDDEGVPLVRVQDLTLRPNGTPPARRVSAQIDRQYSRTRLRGDEVLIGVVGSIGKVGIAPATWAGANIARAVCRIVPSPEIDRAYLAAVLTAAATQQYFQEATRTLAQPTLNVAQLAQTPIPVPPLAEQHHIVAELDALQGEVAALKTAQASRRAELDALLPAILNRAFAGAL